MAAKLSPSRQRELNARSMRDYTLNRVVLLGLDGYFAETQARSMEVPSARPSLAVGTNISRTTCECISGSLACLEWHCEHLRSSPSPLRLLVLWM